MWTRLSSSFRHSHTDWDRLTFAIRSGVPASLRASVWYACSGAAGTRREAAKTYAQYVELGLELQNEAANVIEVDLPRTGVKEEQMSQLRHILRAFAARNPDIGYCQSMNFIAKTLLLYNQEEPTFWLLCSLIENMLPSDYYTQTMSGLRGDLKLLDSLIGTYLPTLKKHLVDRGIDLSPITMNWFLCLFVNTLPAEESHRLLDCLLHEGPKVLFRAALGILHIREQELLKCEAVVDAYVILRAPFGSNDPRIPGESFAAERPQTNLLASMYGPWLRGLSTDALSGLREDHLGTIRQEDQEVAQRRQAWRNQQQAAEQRQKQQAAEKAATHEQEETISAGEESSSTGLFARVPQEPLAEPPEPTQLRAESFALVEQLPVPAKAMGYAERPRDSPKAAASWLARLTGDEVSQRPPRLQVDETGDAAVVTCEGDSPSWGQAEERPICMEGSPEHSFDFWCCRRE